MSTLIHCYLIDKRTQKQDGPYPPASFELKILSLSDEDIQHIYVWRTGLSDWISAIEFRKSIEPIQAEGLPPVPSFTSHTDVDPITPEPARPLITKSSPSSSAYAESKVKVVPQVHEKRKHARFEVRLKCVIRTETISFRTFVKDISLGGIALENEIPKDILDKTCHIFITSLDGSENIKFKVQSAARSELRYFSFDNMDEFTLQKLRQWIYALSEVLGLKAV